MFNFFKHTKQFVLFAAAVRGQLEWNTNKNLNSKIAKNNMSAPHIWNPSNVGNTNAVWKCTIQLVLKINPIEIRHRGCKRLGSRRAYYTCSKLRLFVTHLTHNLL